MENQCSHLTDYHHDVDSEHGLCSGCYIPFRQAVVNVLEMNGKVCVETRKEGMGMLELKNTKWTTHQQNVKSLKINQKNFYLDGREYMLLKLLG